MGIRIAIREQLAFLVVIAVLVGLMILSVPVWIYVNQFVAQVEGRELALTASLKASRISSELELVQTSITTISSRILIQKSLDAFYNGNTSDSNWVNAKDDLKSALSVVSLTGLLQGRLYSRNTTGNKYGLVNVTGDSIPDIELPWTASGNRTLLSDTPEGYPPDLYPNITYADLGRQNPYRNNTRAFSAYAFPDVRLSTNGGLLLGPLVLNETAALISITVPIRDNELPDFILGYMTLVGLANSLISVRNSREGLGDTGLVLLVGPTNSSNRFPIDQPASNATYLPNRDTFGNVPVKFVLPPNPLSGQDDRHNERSWASSKDDEPFPMKDYPAVFDSFSKKFVSPNNSSSMLSTYNEQGLPVAVGFARTNTALVNWTIVVEQAKSEADAPINTLRNIILGCVFGTAGLIIILIFPCAHLSVMPIRRLKSATEKTVQPPGYEDGDWDDLDDDETPGSGAISSRSRRSRKDGIIAAVYKLVGYKPKEKPASEHDRDSTRRIFKIPGKVTDRKHFITDELTELTETFNDMSDELVKQYLSLDQKVLERTRELEISKKAAEAANESKTLFIANISHELKTPLNGILGMCAVCMEENDILRIKQSLKTLYKSGDLLLHLLEDLLSFSKNQIGQQLSLEEKEFRLADIRSQILTIFDKQVREGRITLNVNFLASDVIELSPERRSMDTRLPALGPHGTGRLKDMCLWGDTHRILQVIINLVSNSLKFTPAGGRVDVRIKCIGEAETPALNGEGSRSSSFSKESRRHGRSRHRVGSSSNNSTSSRANSTTENPKGTALTINPMEPKSSPHIHIRERSPTPPPPGAKSYIFEFEVEDTGPGIAEHMQQKVFEPFVQGDLGLSKKFGGTGLGLSICHQLATLMGGSITLKSTVGVGTTFTMQIPLKYVKDRTSSTASSSIKSRPPSVDTIEPPDIPRDPKRNSGGNHTPIKPAGETTAKNLLEQQPRLVGLSQPFFASNPAPKTKRNTKESQMAAIDAAIASKGENSGKLRVLVADDNSTNIEVVSKMLKLEAVYDVTIAKDGQEAYDLVKANMDNNQRFDVIFMDIQMPNLDGLQSTKLIRQMGYKAPIVALTAFSEESNVKECIESGMDEFLSKPIRRPALKQVLKKFATIPEEPETISQTRKTTPESTPQKASNGSAVHKETVNEKADAILPVQANGQANGPSSEQHLSEKGT
ncbi:Two-component system protein B [Colletotrichum sp. SAR 10_86]|nr:Two-component system protein B [Colletotrichum sp. SAR 10_65]KAI8174867.1 Two-component system protein B [Colletotrichum sp. SAR 10_75]KAI8200508.1 Two-component system protein B [Colletotrichum sp. SAR 10_76]KAI8221299.1 Two-component system protein B [Colletotrichum sp. SAR 10_77]KAI8221396.1 Two-component system protein B [Colletotrichum sp. SAR 10_86]